MPELGPCFGNDHPNCGSMEARRSSGFYGRCPVRRHRGNFAGTHTRKTKAERARYPITAETFPFPLKAAAFRRSLMDGSPTRKLWQKSRWVLVTRLPETFHVFASYP